MKLRSLLTAAQRRLPEARRGTLVLAYHLVGSGIDSAIDVSVDRFRHQLDVLQRRFRVLPLDAALTAASERGGEPVATLTFDDAYANFAEVVWPILRERQLTAMLYVPVGFVRGEASAPIRGTRLRACSWDELKALRRDGVQIGSHGVDHLNLRRTSDAELARELGESRAVLEQELGAGVTSFCYPQAKYDARSARAVAQHYQSAVAAGGRRYGGGDRFRIPRFPVRRDEPDFEALVSARLWLREAIANGVRQWRQ